MNQKDKELIIVCLGNSLSDPEQEPIHEDTGKLYTKLVKCWGITGYHSASEIEARRIKVNQEA